MGCVIVSTTPCAWTCPLLSKRYRSSSIISVHLPEQRCRADPLFVRTGLELLKLDLNRKTRTLLHFEKGSALPFWWISSLDGAATRFLHERQSSARGGGRPRVSSCPDEGSLPRIAGARAMRIAIRNTGSAGSGRSPEQEWRCRAIQEEFGALSNSNLRCWRERCPPMLTAA